MPHKHLCTSILLLLFLVGKADAFCFSEASSRLDVDERLLRAIATVESSMNPAAVHRNPDGSYDIGIMQINSGWLPTLRRFGITEADLYNACTNIHVGAWVLSGNIARHGKIWKAVGAYNASTRSKQENYVSLVWKAYRRLAQNKGAGKKSIG